MKSLNLANVTLAALVASCLIQTGAQLFAISVVASTLAEAPPSSFAMLEGEYGYDSSTFWSTVPLITFLLFIIALVGNWKNQRRKLIFSAMTLFIIAGFVAGIFLEPIFEDLTKGGFSDQVDPILQNQAKRWILFDWMVWSLGLLAGLLLLVAINLPAKVQMRTAENADSLNSPENE